MSLVSFIRGLQILSAFLYTVTVTKNVLMLFLIGAPIHVRSNLVSLKIYKFSGCQQFTITSLNKFVCFT